MSGRDFNIVARRKGQPKAAANSRQCLGRMSAAVRPKHENPATPSNGHDSKYKLQDTLDHLPLQLPRDVWWREWAKKLRERVKKGWAKVAPKTEGRYSISQALALTIVAASLGFGGTMYWRSQEQHDKIIKLETTVEILQKANTDRDAKIDQAMNWGQSAKSDVKYLQGKFDQFALDYAVKEKKPQ